MTSAVGVQRKIAFCLVGLVVLTAVGGAAWYSWRAEISQSRSAAVTAFKAGEWSAAATLLSALAHKGDREAQELLGLCYAYGLGVPRNKDRAQSLIAASHSGDTTSRLATSYFHVAREFDYPSGLVLERDENQAFEWYLLAAELGHQDSQHLVALAFAEGRFGVTPDPQRAEYWRDRLEDSKTESQ